MIVISSDLLVPNLICQWQRKKILTIMKNEPEILIDGDIEQLKKDLEEMRLKAEQRKAFRSKFGMALI